MRPTESQDKRQDGLEEWDDILSMHPVAHCSVSLRPLLSYCSNHHHHHHHRDLERYEKVGQYKNGKK